MSTGEKNDKAVKIENSGNNGKTENFRKSRYNGKSNRNEESKNSALRKQKERCATELYSNTGIEKGSIQDAIERNKYTLDLVNMWISNADNKIEMAFAILSAILALIVFIADDVLSGLDVTNANPCLMCWFKLLVICAGGCFVFSVLFYIKCIYPRLTNDKLKDKKYSIFYHEIKDFENYKDYIAACETADDKLFNEEIVKEIYFNSVICSQKMRNFRTGLIFSMISIGAALLAALVYYLAAT